jgi:hypothetical protein
VAEREGDIEVNGQNPETDNQPSLITCGFKPQRYKRRFEITLELYADPSNWTPDGKFVPVMKHIDATDPFGPAREALERGDY